MVYAARIVLLAGAWLWLVGCGHVSPRGGSVPVRFLTVSFPHVALAENESIQLVQIEVVNGQVAALNRIPSDWSLELNEDCSDCTLLARHFSAGLCSPRALDGLITVAAGHPSRFDIRTRLVVGKLGADGSTEREISLFPVDLDMKGASPATRPAVTCDVSKLASECFTEYRPPARLANANGEYVVHLGDTAAAIARDFQLSSKDLKAINPEMDPIRLRVGQVIKVVKGRKD